MTWPLLRGNGLYAPPGYGTKVLTWPANPDRVSPCPAIDADPITHFVVVRADLPVGHKLAQAVHAAGETGPAASGTFAVVLAVLGEAELRALSARLTESQIAHVLVREPDAPYSGAATALGIPPRRRSELRPHLKELPLCR